MSYLTDIMEKRKNIQYFKDEAPDKNIIDDILKKAHDLTPHKNNHWFYRIRIFGPEHKEEKKLLGMASATGKGKDMVRSGKKSDIDKLSKIYDEWCNNMRRKELKVEGCNFNIQVTAPYLLVYTHQPNYMTNTQKESSYVKERHDIVFKSNSNLKNTKDWVIQSAMHGISTAYLCAEKDLYASFCRCYFYNHFIHTDILRPEDDIAFMLGIGYKDETKPYFPSLVKKPTYDEITEWA